MSRSCYEASVVGIWEPRARVNYGDVISDVLVGGDVSDVFMMSCAQDRINGDITAMEK